jgi:hypothetical protein
MNINLESSSFDSPGNPGDIENLPVLRIRQHLQPQNDGRYRLTKRGLIHETIKRFRLNLVDIPILFAGN